MLKEKEKVLLEDEKGKKYIFELKKGEVFVFHQGKIL